MNRNFNESIILRGALLIASWCVFGFVSLAQGVMSGQLLHQIKTLQAETKSAANGKMMSNGINDKGIVLTVIARLADGKTCPTSKLENMGITVQQQVYNSVILEAPLDKVMSLEGMEEFESFNANQTLKKENDQARVANSVVFVNGEDNDKWQSSGLKSKYTGKGIIVGIIDGGFEYNHLSYLNSDGTSRVKMVVDLSTSTDKVYTTPQEIAALTTDITSDCTSGGSHGGHVAATAAGSPVTVKSKNGTCSYDLQGMAPEADLVFCGLGDSIQSSRIMKSVKYIFDYADAQKKPCVINISLGGTKRFKDGTATVISTYNDATNNGQRQGRIIIKSAGNLGGKYTMRHKMSGATPLQTILDTWTFTKYNGQTVNAYSKISIVAYNAMAGKPLTAEYITVDANTGKVYSLDEKPIYKYKETGGVATYGDALKQLTTTADRALEKTNNKYIYTIFCDSVAYKEPNLLLGLRLTAEDGDILMMMNEDIEFINTINDKKVVTGFTAGNGEASIDGDGCTASVISVGQYCSRYSHPDYTEQIITRYTRVSEEKAGPISPSSSWGYDDYGNTYPDVIAPGSQIISAMNSYYAVDFTNTGLQAQPKYKETLDNIKCNTDIAAMTTVNNNNYWYGNETGTSMATPNVTGIVALWLQADPTLTVAKVRQLIQSSTDNDIYTTDVSKIPSGNKVQAGAGKINALKGLLILEKDAGVSQIENSKLGTESFDGVRKVVKDGHVLIIKDGKPYTVTGVSLK